MKIYKKKLSLILDIQKTFIIIEWICVKSPPQKKTRVLHDFYCYRTLAFFPKANLFKIFKQKKVQAELGSLMKSSTLCKPTRKAGSSFFLTGCHMNGLMDWLVQSRQLFSCLWSIWVYLFRLSIHLLSSNFKNGNKFIFGNKNYFDFFVENNLLTRGLFLTRVGEGKQTFFYFGLLKII